MQTNGMPEGLVWPQFEDGAPVNIGDYIVNECGKDVKVRGIYFSHEGCWRITDYMTSSVSLSNGEKCKRPFYDSWEKLENDAQKPTHEYWDCENLPCSLCPSMIDGKTPFAYYGCGGCVEASRKDIVARAKKIAEHERRNDG